MNLLLAAGSIRVSLRDSSSHCKSLNIPFTVQLFVSYGICNIYNNESRVFNLLVFQYNYFLISKKNKSNDLWKRLERIK